ncbi:hypothetical protein VDG1235_2210 [Verrucomicrobiia bacterium DG1235]|nr:hypothetical protein VDG1235_2210 [Verrucomicrobiae bacterium DG1235]
MHFWISAAAVSSTWMVSWMKLISLERWRSSESVIFEYASFGF